MSSGQKGQRAADTSSLRILIENRLEQIDRVKEVFEAFSIRHGLPNAVRRAVEIAFDDVLHNIISYAYDGHDRRTIGVTVELWSDRLRVLIADDGHPFDPTALRAPDLSLGIEEREVGGLGIYLVENLMDEVSYSRLLDGNELVLVKYLTIDPRSG